jgi:hypothetical protein
VPGQAWRYAHHASRPAACSHDGRGAGQLLDLCMCALGAGAAENSPLMSLAQTLLLTPATRSAGSCQGRSTKQTVYDGVHSLCVLTPQSSSSVSISCPPTSARVGATPPAAGAQLALIWLTRQAWCSWRVATRDWRRALSACDRPGTQARH